MYLSRYYDRITIIDKKIQELEQQKSEIHNRIGQFIESCMGAYSEHRKNKWWFVTHFDEIMSYKKYILNGIIFLFVDFIKVEKKYKDEKYSYLKNIDMRCLLLLWDMGFTYQNKPIIGIYFYDDVIRVSYLDKNSEKQAVFKHEDYDKYIKIQMELLFRQASIYSRNRIPSEKYTNARVFRLIYRHKLPPSDV